MIKIDSDRRFEMHKQGMTDNQMAEALGIQKQTVSLWRRTQNLPPNKRRAVKVQGDTVAHFVKFLHVLDSYQSMKIEHIGKAMDVFKGGLLCDIY